MKKPSVNIISLGCSKNLVDSEKLMRQLSLGGWEVHFESSGAADVVLINTCGFIADAKEESVDTILAAIEAKKRGTYGRVIIFGCLVQRYRTELLKDIPEADHFFGLEEQDQMLRSMNAFVRPDHLHERILTNAGHYAYLKISEGCSRQCSFCSIPFIRGKHSSVNVEMLVREARHLRDQGVKELLLVAQDLSSYGADLKHADTLVHLLDALEALNGIEWIRLHYAYPAGFPRNVITKMAQSEKMVHYLDIPFQHASDRVLRAMRRGHLFKDNQRIISELRTAIPDIAIRTTLITGFPGETEEDFEALVDFVRINRFERLGVFTYSEEEGTAAARMPDDVPVEVKHDRAALIMSIQEQISLEKNRERIGTVTKVLIDRVEDGQAIGRTQYDSPEVDNEVILGNAHQCYPGDFILARVHDATPFELMAEIVVPA